MNVFRQGSGTWTQCPSSAPPEEGPCCQHCLYVLFGLPFAHLATGADSHCPVSHRAWEVIGHGCDCAPKLKKATQICVRCQSVQSAPLSTYWLLGPILKAKGPSRNDSVPICREVLPTLDVRGWDMSTRFGESLGQWDSK